MGGVYSIDAHLRLTATLNQPFSPAGDELIEATTADPEGFGRDVRAITVTNAIDAPCGHFDIELAPRSVIGDKTWAEVVRPYTLTSIAMWRQGSGPAATAAPAPVMLGLVDRPSISAEYSQAAPRRSVHVTGRTLSGVLSDHRWWFHNLLASVGNEAAFIPPDFREFFAERPSEALLRDEVNLRTLGLLAIDPNFLFVVDRKPTSLTSAVWDFFVRGTADRDPFVKLHFSDGVPLSDRLRFDADTAAAAYFDPAAALVQQMLPHQMPNASLWDVLRNFQPSPWSEIFTETRGDSLGNAFVELVARKPPWAGEVTYFGDVAVVDFPGGSRPALRGQSLFDAQRPGWDREAETVYVDDGDVIGEPDLHQDSADGVFNLYLVLPNILASTGNQGQATWEQIIAPIIDEDPLSPSYIRTFGVRPFRAQLNTIPIVDAQGDSLPSEAILRRCLCYAALAREWFYRAPHFWRGAYVLKGNTNVRVGKRLVDLNRSREYYITRVAHRQTFGRDPTFTTIASVSRGWDLDPSSLQ